MRCGHAPYPALSEWALRPHSATQWSEVSVTCRLHVQDRQQSCQACRWQCSMNGAPLDNDRDNVDDDENIDSADKCLFDTTKLLYIGIAAVSKYNVF